MIRSKFCFAAEGIIRDAESNSISIFNILEGINSEGFPIFIQRIAFIALWERDPQDVEQPSGTFKLTINDHPLVELGVRVEFADKLSHRNIVYLNGLMVPKPGTLRFHISLETGAQTEYLVEVTASQPASARTALDG